MKITNMNNMQMNILPPINEENEDIFYMVTWKLSVTVQSQNLKLIGV
jgi:hypothetical protein